MLFGVHCKVIDGRYRRNLLEIMSFKYFNITVYITAGWSVKLDFRYWELRRCNFNKKHVGIPVAIP